MKLFKRLLALALVAAFALAFVACGNDEDKTDDGKYVIGISQLMIHDALDAATQGFKDALIAELGEENVEFLFQDAAGSPDTCATIASTFVTKDVDLILANATPAGMALKRREPEDAACSILPATPYSCSLERPPFPAGIHCDPPSPSTVSAGSRWREQPQEN